MAETRKHFFCLGLSSLCFLTFCSAASHMMTNLTTDQYAVLALKAHITWDPNHILAKNWSVDSPVCDWIGVACGLRHIRVTVLNISDMSLTGTIPPELGNLSFLVSLDMSANKFHGKLPNEFSLFRRLKVLNLRANNLAGRLPDWLGSLHELEYLSLGNNSFSGAIPPSISNLSNLAAFGLQYNSLRGNIPAEIFNISSLERINLNGDGLSGSLPECICHRLGRLTGLSLSLNELSGRLPSGLGQCVRLKLLSLSFNQFTGVIPKEIGNLNMLEGLALGRNRFQGAVPETIGNLTMLKALDISNNNLTGEIPKDIGNLTMLTILYLRNNNITGAIPRGIGNFDRIEQMDFGINQLSGSIPLPIFNLSTIQLLALELNQLSGNLPATMGYGLANLESLYLTGNSLIGPIPESISNSSKLHLIQLGYNSFTGPIPNSIGDLRLLEILDLFNNNLTSDSAPFRLSIITSLTNCKYLKDLSLNNNPLDGILPDSIGNLSTSLETIFLYNCEIRGGIPSGIGNLSDLVTLNLEFNQLTGSLPGRIKDLQKLQGLFLGGNQISSGLHFLCFCQSLGVIELEDNHLSGPIPGCLGNNTTSLRYILLGSNRLNSDLPMSVWIVNDLLELNLSSNSLSGSLSPEIKNLKVAILIDLSMNQFSGGIPSTIEEMQNLNYLLLDHNRFHGPIPESVGKMLSLQAMDLSCNFLTGTIPMSLETLKYLTFLNVSFNNLSGEIPSGGPFKNFSAAFFISNEALCGDQRFQVPPCPTSSAHDHTLRTKKVHRIVILLLVVSLVAGCAITFGLVYRRYRRQRRRLSHSQAQADLSLVTHERISYYKLLQATGGYSQSNLLGTGNFGSVYKGTLDDGRVVAIKVFHLQQEGSFNSFEVEAEALRNLRHRNLTKVISVCSTPDFKALALQYMPNGSLDKWLYSPDYSLNITQRLDIMIDVACALQYLHSENPTPVVHCDLKPSNVLLDEAMVAHLTDFGVAKLLGHEDSIRYTETLATLCYIAPEYGMDGLVSTKCDVYSFGIMMMEVFTGTDPNHEMFGDNLNLKSWVEASMSDGLVHVIDANLLRITEKEFHEMLPYISSILEVALTCTYESPRGRADMQDVLAALNKIKFELLQFQRG